MIGILSWIDTRLKLNFYNYDWEWCWEFFLFKNDPYLYKNYLNYFSYLNKKIMMTSSFFFSKLRMTKSYYFKFMKEIEGRKQRFYSA